MLAIVWLLPVPGGPSIVNERPASAAATQARCPESAASSSGGTSGLRPPPRQGGPGAGGPGACRPARGQGAHRRVRHDLVAVVGQILVHRFGHGRKAREHHAVADLPAGPARDLPADRVEQPGQ